MKTSWKSFKQWCHAHPFKFAVHIFAACVIANLYGSIPTVAFFATVGFYLLYVIVTMSDEMKILAYIAMAAIAMPTKAQERQPEVGGVAIGVTVIVIGGVAYYFLTKTCQRLFPKPPSKTNELYSVGTPTDCAASFSYQSPHSCKLPDPSLTGDEQPSTVMDIEIEGGAAPRIVEIRRSASPVVAFHNFSDALLTHGIQLSERPGEAYYGLNGRPADGSQVPISFDPSDNSVIVGRGPIRKLTVERSADFETWEPMITTSLADGQRAVVLDASEGRQMFYRVR